MKIALALTLLLAADCVASGTPQPTLLVCILHGDTPKRAESVVVNEKIEAVADDSYVSARATAAKDVTIDGTRFKVTADGGYSMNSDGSMYLPNLLLQVRDETSGWSIESRAGERASLDLAHNKSAVRGLISCRLQ